LAELQCPSLSSEVLEIYRSLDLTNLAPEHLAVIIKFLFSTNGIFSNRVTVQSLASHMFLKEYKSNSELFKPFSFDLLHLLTEQVLANIDTIFNKKELLSMDIF